MSKVCTHITSIFVFEKTFHFKKLRILFAKNYIYFVKFCVLLYFFQSQNAIAQCVAHAGPDTSYCIGGTGVTIGAFPAASGAGAPFTYSWSPATGLSCINCANPVSTTTVPITYTLTVTGSMGCSDSETVIVTPITPPIANFTFANNNGCANIPVVFTSTSVGAGISYSWNFNNPSSGTSNTSTMQNPFHVFVAEGNGTQVFNVVLTITNAGGCSSSVTLPVTVKRTPGAALLDPIADMKNCDGSTFNMNVLNTSVSTSNSNYQIIWGDGTPSYNSTTFASGGVLHTYTTADIFDMIFVVTGINGCIDSSFYNVANITNPAIGAANPGGTTGCGPLNLCFPLSNYTTNHPSTYYVVNYGDGSPKDTLLHPPPAVLCHTYATTSCGLAGNSFTFKITAINRCDSSTATISPIRVYLGPVANFTVAPNPGCVNSAITMLNSTQTGFNSSCAATTLFNWDFGDGTTLVATSLISPTHVYTLPGTYTVTLTAQNSCGLTSKVRTVCIEIPPVPLFTMSPTTGCSPLLSTVINTSSTLNTCNVTRLWTVSYLGTTCAPSAGTFTFVGGTNNQSVNPQFQFTGPGTYVVRLTFTNSCGSFFSEQTVTVKGFPQVAISPLTAICQGNSILPTANINNCYDPITNYNWTFTSGLPASSSTLIPGNIQFSNAGTFTVNLGVTNSCGTVNATQNIIVNPLPPNLNPTVNANVCVGQTANFSSNAVAGISYTWRDPSNNIISTLQNFSLSNVTAANAGTYTLTGAFGTCVGTIATVNLVVTVLPIVTVTPSASICLGSSITLTAAGASSYTWLPATNLSATSGSVVIANPTSSVTYIVTGTNGSCSGTASTTITVNALPIVDAGLDLTLCNQPLASQLVGSPAGGTWSGPNVTPSGMFTPSGVGSFTLSYAFTNANVCSNTDNVVITVISPTVTDAGIDQTLCVNATNQTLVGTPAGGTWSGPGVVGNVFDPTVTGSFVLTYTSGIGTCQTSDTKTVTVINAPLVNAGADFGICEGAGNQTLIGNPVGGTWTGTGITNPVGTFNPLVAGVGTFTITYTYSDLISGCSNVDQLNVTVFPLPTVNAGIDTSVCNQAIGFQVVGTPIGGTWSGANVTSTGQFTPNGIGTFTITYSFTNANGCTKIDTRVVTVVNPVNANAGMNTAVCIDGANVALLAVPMSGTWSGPGVTAAGIFDPTIAGTFELFYSFGAGACFTKDSMEITVHPLPIVNAGIDFTQCISAAPSVVAGLPAGGTWSGTGITNPLGNFSPITVTAGAHILTYTFVNPTTGCTNSDQLTATVNALPLVNAGSDTIICNQPFPVQFNANPAGGTWSGTNISSSGIFTPSTVGAFPLTYTFINGNFCSNSDVRIITVVAPVLPNAGPDFSVCIDALNVVLAPIPSAGIWTGTDVTTAGIFNPTTAGNFELIYSIGAGNCLRKDSLVVIVNPLPIVSTGPDLSFCPADTPVNLLENPIGGAWSGNGITNSATGQFNPALPPIGAHNLMYTYTNPVTGCANSDVTIATIHPTPIPVFAVNPVVCAGVSVPFTNTSSFGATYGWNFGDNTTAITEDPNHIYATQGFYTAQLLVTSAFGCVDSISQPVEVRIPPTSNFTLTPDSACAPVIVAFTNLSSGPSITFAWNFGNGVSSTVQNPGNQTFLQGVLADTSYEVSLNVTNFCGTANHTETVIAMPKPTANFGTNTDIGCSPLNLQFNNISLGLPDSYTWNFGNGTAGANGLGVFTQQFTTGTSDTTFTIMLAVANECGVDTAVHTITVLPNSVTAFFNMNDPDGCVPHQVNFTQFSSGATFTSWNFGDGNVSATANPVHTFTTPGIYTVSLFANDGCGFDTITQTVTVFPSPFVAFNSEPDSVCINAPFQFDNQSIGLASSSWTFGDGSSSSLFNPAHTYIASGTYTVVLTGVSLINGCTASVTHPVVVSTNPVAAVTATPISGCMPLIVNFNNLSSNTNFQAWNFADGNFSTNFSPTHTYTSAGNFSVKLNVENANGCKDSTTVLITVYPKPIAQFTTTNTNSCYPPVTLTTANTSVGAVNYTWIFGDGAQSTLTNPTHIYANAGTFTINLIASTIYGCKDTADRSIAVYNTPIANFSLPKDTVCEGESLIFNSTSSFADSITWDFGNGSIFTGNNVLFDYQNSGTFPITIFANGPGGCADTLTLAQTIVVNPSPTANFDYVNIQNPDPLSGIVEFSNMSIDANSYWWTFGNGDTSSMINPVERYNDFGDFDVMLVAYNLFGCTDTSFQSVNVDFFYGLFIPNAISPAHPEFEVSHFIPKGVGLAEFELLIYDDWGNLIWSTTALDAEGRPTESWDGMYNGAPVQQDSYVWKASATFMNFKVWEGKKYEKGKGNGLRKFKRSGSVTVIR
jgi:large repetitive protein